MTTRQRYLQAQAMADLRSRIISRRTSASGNVVTLRLDLMDNRPIDPDAITALNDAGITVRVGAHDVELWQTASSGERSEAQCKVMAMIAPGDNYE